MDKHLHKYSSVELAQKSSICINVVCDEMMTSETPSLASRYFWLEIGIDLLSLRLRQLINLPCRAYHFSLWYIVKYFLWTPLSLYPSTTDTLLIWRNDKWLILFLGRWRWRPLNLFSTPARLSSLSSSSNSRTTFVISFNRYRISLARNCYWTCINRI